MTGEDRKGGGGGKLQQNQQGDLTSGNNTTDTAVRQHQAQQNGTVEKAPVVAGTNVETLPRQGKQGDPSTVFLRAARAGQLEKVLEYLDSGVDINSSNANGLNALHLAAKDGHFEIVQELLKRGAIVDAATKKGNTALHIASLAGQEEVVQLLVQQGASVNAQSQNGFTPLYMAAQENHDSVVKFLLGKGANQTLATEDGFTPLAVAMQQGHDKVVAVLLENDTRGKVRLPALHIAAKKDDCKAAALLLENDHNPDVISKSGFTPLHIAAHYGNDRIASLLYEKGADVNFAAKHNITPMHVAAKWGKIKMVNLLISKGANIEAKTRDGLTPLHCAARSGHHEVVDILIEKGAPIGSKTKNGLAPLHMASQGDHVDAARILLYHRAPVDDVTVDYLTALHVAAHCGHVRVAKLLLDRNADPNARALNGFTPLHIACKKNRIKVVELLLKHKASIEATTESGLTPLHVASFMGCMNIVIYLLQHEASPDIPTVRGETPLHLAARANQTDIIRILLRNGAQVDARAREEQTPLHVASRLGNVDIVMLLLQHGADIDATTKDLYTPLHIAAKEAQEEVASVLLENGASLNAATKKGFTPLHLAAKYGNMNVARLLLQKNAPVDAQGKNGVTPLHVASHYDHQNVALLLLDKGASPHAMAKNGHTPLHIAARKNQMDIATTLLEYGAKANAESKAGFTPLHLSAEEGHTDMSTLLIEHKADTNHKAKNGLTPLHLCAQADRVNVASILVKNGAQIDAKTKAGYTPLHVAAHFGQAAMVRFLLSNGASVDSSTSAGYTPLHQAAQQGHTLVINLLLESKAQPNAVTHNGQTALDIAQKLGYISVVETLKVVTETTITTSHTITIEEKYKVQAPESMQETFMSDSEDEGGGDEIGVAAMNVYGQPAHAQHVYLPSYYQGQMTYTREDPMLSDQQQYRYMTGDDMKSMGDDSMRVNVTDDERDNRHSGAPTITEMITKESYNRQNAANHKPDNVNIHRHPVHVGRIPSWRNFLVSFLVDARGGAMRGCRHSGVRVIVPPRKATMPMRVTCRYLKRDKLSNPPPLMEGEALASRILELGPVGAKFLGPVIIEVPHFASLRGKEREIVILRSDNGETWREHTLEASEEAVQDVLNESFEGEELSQLEDLQTSRIVRVLTVDFPHYFAVVSRIRQEVHAVGPEGGTVSSSAVPQVQAIFPQSALTKKIRVGLQAHPIPAELVAKLLGNRVAVSPIVTVEPRRRKFHKPIILTIPVPQAANKGMINQYSGDAPTLRLLCSITGGQSRAVWEDVTGSTPLNFVKDCVSFTTTVSARFWLMDCRNISEATKMATELYTHATHVPFMAKFVVFAKRVDPLEARLRVFCMTDDKEDKTLEHQEHFTEVAKSRDVEVLEGKTQYMEFAGNLVPVLKSGEQLQLPFRAFKENRVPFTVRVKDPDAADNLGRIMFMCEPKVAKGEPSQTPICTLNILLPDKISPDGGSSELDLLELSKNYSFLRDGGLSRPDAIHRATIRMTDIANLLGSDWEKLAHELNVTPNEISQIKEEYPDKTAQQATAMFKVWQSSGNKVTGNTLEKALNKIGREDIVKKCIFNVELVTDDVEKAVARVRLDQPGFDSLKDELGPSRDTSLRRDATMDPKMDPDYDEPDRMKDSESIEDISMTGGQKTPKQHITITNGTSTPIKDKYASDEKELGDMMADFLEHKYHSPETMVKKSRDENDDDNKKRQQILEDANKIVSGIKQDAEKEMGKLAKEGWSVVSDDDVRKNDEVGYVVKQQKHSLVDGTSEASEPPIIQQQCIVGTNGDRTITTITTKTIITTNRNDGRQTLNNNKVDYDIPDFAGPDPKVLGIHSSSHPNDKSILKPMQHENIVTNKSSKSKEKRDPQEKSMDKISVAKTTNSVEIETVKKKTDSPEPLTDSVKDNLEASLGYDNKHNVQNSDQETQDEPENESKKLKDKSSRIFSGIFKTPRLKKDKSKDSKEVSFDSGDEDTRLATVKLLDDARQMADLMHENDPAISREAKEKSPKLIDSCGDDTNKEKSHGLFAIFMNPKTKSKRSKSKEKQTSNDVSFDSGDEDVKKSTATFLQDIQMKTDNTNDPALQKITLIDADSDDDSKKVEVSEPKELKKVTEQQKSKTAHSEKSGSFFKKFKSPKLKSNKSSSSTEKSDSRESSVDKSEEKSKPSHKTIAPSENLSTLTSVSDIDIKEATSKFLEDSRNASGIIDACPYKSDYLYKTSIIINQHENNDVPEDEKTIEKTRSLSPDTKGIKTATKKGKEKTGGFLTAIFKGGKQAKDDITDEVKNVEDRIEKQVLESEQVAQATSGKVIEDTKELAATIGAGISDAQKSVQDNLKEASKKLDDTQKKLDNKIREESDKIKTGLARAESVGKDDGKNLDHKLDSAAQDAKSGSKKKGFFSGLISNAKSTADGLVEEVREFVDETKLESLNEEQRLKKEAQASAKRVQDSAGKLDSKISEAGKKIEDQAIDRSEKLDEVHQITAEKIHQTSESVKADLSNVGSSIKTKAHKTKQNILDMEQKVKDDSATVAEQISQGLNELSSDVDRMLSQSKEVGDTQARDLSQEFVDAERQATDRVLDGAQSIGSDLVKIESENKIAHEEPKSASKKSKGGFLSSMFKGGKQVKDDVVDDLKNVEDRIEKKVHEGEELAHDASSKVVQDTKELAGKIGAKLSDAQKSVEDNLEEASKKLDDELREESEKIKTGLPRAESVGKEEGKKLEHKLDSSAKDVKSGSKKKGFFSGIISNAKSTADGLVEEVREFVDETKLESLNEEQRLKKEAKASAKRVHDFGANLDAKISETGKKIKDQAIDGGKKLDEVHQITAETIEETFESAKADLEDVGSLVKTKAHKTKQNILDMEQKVKDDGAKMSKEVTQGLHELSTDIDRMLSQSKEVGDTQARDLSQEFVNAERQATDRVLDGAQSIGTDLVKIESDTNNGHADAKSASKKGKGGFLSSIFKGGKQVKDDVIDDVKKVEARIEKNVHEGEELAHDVSGKVIADSKELMGTIRTEVSEAQKSVEENLKDASKKLDDKRQEESEKIETRLARAESVGKEEVEKLEQKLDSVAQDVKSGSKKKGFFSGLISNAKSTADGLVGEVREFVDETKLESLNEEKRLKKEAQTSIKPVQDSVGQLNAKISETGKKIKDQAIDGGKKLDEVHQITAETIEETFESAKADLEDVGSLVKTKAHKTKQNILDMEQKVKDDGAKVTKEVSQGLHELSTDIDRMLSQSKEVGDTQARDLSQEFVNAERQATDRVLDGAQSIGTDLVKIESDTNNGHADAKSASKKGKGGFLSSIFKGGKQVKDDVIDDVKKVEARIEKNVHEGEELAHDASSKVVEDTKELAGKIGAKLSDAQKSVEDNLEEASKKLDDELREESEKIKTGLARAESVGKDEGKKLEHKLDSSAKDVKSGSKKKGFFSGLISNAKSTADGLVEEVREFVDETKLESLNEEQRLKKEAQASAKRVQDSAGKLDSKISEAGKKIKDQAIDRSEKLDEVHQITAEKIHQTSESVKADLSNVGSSIKTKAHKTKQNILDMEQKVKDDSATVAEQISQGLNELSSDVDRMLSQSKEVGDTQARDLSQEFVDAERPATDRVLDGAQSIGSDLVKIESENKIAHEEPKSASKKSKGGFLSSMFKGGKQVKDDVVDDLKNVEDRIEKKVHEGEELAHDASSKVVQDTKELAGKIGAKLSDAQKSVEDNLEEASKKLDDKLREESEKIKTGLTRAESVGKDEGKKLEHKLDSSARDVKSGSKKKGFFSGLISNAKSTADGLVEEVREFVDETKLESLNEEQRLKKEAKAAAKRVQDSGANLDAKISETGKKIKDQAIDGGKKLDEVHQITAETIEETFESAKADLEDVGSLVKTKAHQTKENILDMEQKVKDDGAKVSKEVTQGIHELSTDIDRMLSQSKEVGDTQARDLSQEFVDAERQATDRVLDGAQSIGSDLVKIESENKIAHEEPKSASKKSKGGFLSSIFKGGKQVKDDVIDDVYNVEHRIEKKVHEGEELAHDTSSKVVQDTKELAGKISPKLSDAQKSVEDNLEEASKKLDDKLREESEKIKTGLTRAESVGKDEGKKLEHKLDSSARDVKSGSKKKGFFSGLISNAKSTADGLVEEVREFVDETKLESLNEEQRLKKEAKAAAKRVQDSGANLDAKISETGKKIKDQAIDGGKKLDEVHQITAETIEETFESAKADLEDVGSLVKTKAHQTKENILDMEQKVKDDGAKVSKEVTQGVHELSTDIDRMLSQSKEVGDTQARDLSQEFVDAERQATDRVLDGAQSIGSDLVKIESENKIAHEEPKSASKKSKGGFLSSMFKGGKQVKDDVVDDLKNVEDRIEKKVHEGEELAHDASSKVVQDTKELAGKIGAKLSDAQKSVEDNLEEASKKLDDKLREESEKIKTGLTRAESVGKDEGKKLEHKLDSSARDVKSGSKKKGFFSGLISNAKSTADGLVEEVREFVDETKLESLNEEQRLKKEAKAAAKRVQDSGANLDAKISETGKKIKDQAIDGGKKLDEVHQITAETIEETFESAKADLEDVGSLVKTKAHQTKENILDMEQKVKDDGAKVSKEVTQGVHELSTDIDRMLSQSKEVGDTQARDLSQEFVDAERQATERVLDGAQSIGSDLVKIESENKIAHEEPKSASKKSKGGFLSSMFKGGKQVKDDVVDDLKNVEDRIEKKVHEGEELAHDASSKVVQDTKELAGKIGAKLSDPQKSVEDNLEEASKKLDDKLREESEKIKTGLTRAESVGKEEGKKLEHKLDSSAKDVKSGSKKKGFFSGLISNAKSTADGLVEEVREFVDETKLESLNEEQRLKKEAKAAAKRVQDSGANLDAKISETGKKIKDQAIDGGKKLDEVHQITAEIIEETFESAKADLEDVGSLVNTKAHQTKENILDMEQKVKDDGAKVSKEVTQGLHELSSDIDRMLNQSEEVGDTQTRDLSQEFVDAERQATDRVLAGAQSIGTDLGKIECDTKTAHEDAKSASKKGKGGFLSSIFKGGKQVKDDVIDDVYNVEHRIEKKVHEGEELAHDTSSKVVQDTKELAGKISPKLSDAQKSVEDNLEEASKKLDDKLREESEKIKTGMARAESVGKEEGKKLEHKLDNAAQDVKPGSKKKGFFSGLISNAKSTADSLVEEVREFVDETKLESINEEQRLRKEAQTSAKRVQDSASKLDAKISDVGKEIKDQSIDGGDKFVDQAIGESVEKIDIKIRDVEQVINEKLKPAEQQFDSTKLILRGNLHELSDKGKEYSEASDSHMSNKSDKLIKTTDNVLQKASGVANSEMNETPLDNDIKLTALLLDDMKKNSESYDPSSIGPRLQKGMTNNQTFNLDKSAKKPKVKSSSFFQGIFKSSKDSSDSEGESIVVGINQGKETKDAKNKATKYASDAKSPTKKDKVNKASGFLSGIFKGGPNDVDQIKNDVKELPEDLERQTFKEEKKIKTAVSDTSEKKDATINAQISDTEKDITYMEKDIENKINEAEKTPKCLIQDVKDNLDHETKNVNKTIINATYTTESAVKDGKKEASGYLSSILKKAGDTNDLKDEIHNVPDDSTIESRFYYNIPEESDSRIHICICPPKIERTVPEEGPSTEETDQEVEKELRDLYTTEAEKSTDQKQKKKSGSFISSMVRGVKHVFDEVEDEVKEFVQETRNEAIQEQERAKTTVQEKDNELFAKVKSNLDETGDPLRDKADKICTAIDDSTIDKFADKKIKDKSSSFKTSKDIRDPLTDEDKKLGDKMIKEVIKMEKAVEKAAHDVTDRTLSDIEKSTVKIDTQVTEGEQTLKDTTDRLTIIENDSDKKLQHLSDKVKSDLKKTDDAVKCEFDKINKLPNHAATDAKSGAKKSKSSGFFSGIFKGSKHPTYELEKDTVEEVKEITLESEKKVKKIDKAMKDEETPETLIDFDVESISYDQQRSCIEEPIDYRDQSQTKKTDSINVNELILRDPITATQFLLEDSRNVAAMTMDPVPVRQNSESSSESSSLRNSLERDSENKMKKEKKKKSKKGDVLSSIVRKTKGATHKIAKEVDHAAEGIKEATGKFWDETKRESKESRPSGSYDVTTATSSSEQVRDEVALGPDLNPETTNIVYSTPEVVVDKVESRIPKIIKTYQQIERSEVQTQEEITITREEVRIVAADVSSSLTHVEPHAHQTVTTVIKKSVTTAATPPPSPAEFTDVSSKDITEEAAKRAQLLADNALTQKQSGHETVERHATTVADYELTRMMMTTFHESPEDELAKEMNVTEKSERRLTDSWRTMSEASAPAELWEASPGDEPRTVSNNNNNGSTRTISDTESEGSPQRRRGGKRRTLGSSSGSDVALHEGAELSPMEDDQGDVNESPNGHIVAESTRLPMEKSKPSGSCSCRMIAILTILIALLAVIFALEPQTIGNVASIFSSQSLRDTRK
ncbi:titin homolog isoform X2 [Phymastichus coffea]|uniref:titin homolog isoform X2 n=1 Tax=Phymastichus coffea TaxID=108790 RepID=UPI00273AADB3|nr:titin homolog isoform X2 [Phymastichus coffea]